METDVTTDMAHIDSSPFKEMRSGLYSTARQSISTCHLKKNTMMMELHRSFEI